MVLGASTVLTALALVLIAWSSAPASAGASPSRGGAVADQPGRPAVVVVQSGDSLWSIAQRLAPGSDPRSVVARLERLNKLADGAQLVPGQQLRTG
jgi:Tfp pilus assembly protein FimV